MAISWFSLMNKGLVSRDSFLLLSHVMHLYKLVLHLKQHLTCYRFWQICIRVGVAENAHLWNTIIRYAICLKNLKMQWFYYTIKSKLVPRHLRKSLTHEHYSVLYASPPGPVYGISGVWNSSQPTRLLPVSFAPVPSRKTSLHQLGWSAPTTWRKASRGAVPTTS